MVKVLDGISNITVKLLAVCFFQSIVGGINYFIALYFSSIYISKVENIDIGFIISASAIGSVLASVAARKYITNYSKIISIFSLIGQSISLLLISHFHSFYINLLSMFILGASGTLFLITLNYLITCSNSQTSELSNNIIKLQYVVSNSGMAIGFVLLGYCAEGYLKIIFNLLSLMLFFMGIYLFNVYKKINNKKVDSAKVEKTAKFQKTNIKYVWFGLASIFLVNFLFSQHRVVYPEILKYVYRNEVAGWVSALNPVLIILINLFILRKVDALLDKKFLTVAGIICVSLSGAFYLFHINAIIIFVSCALFSFGEAISYNSSQYLCFNYSSKENQGYYLSCFRGFIALASILGAPIAGIMTALWGVTSIWDEFLIISIILLIAAPFVFATKNRLISVFST